MTSEVLRSFKQLIIVNSCLADTPLLWTLAITDKTTVEPQFNEVAGGHPNLLKNRGFVISRLFFIYFTITGAKNTFCYIKVFVKRHLLNRGSTVQGFD